MNRALLPHRINFTKPKRADTQNSMSWRYSAINVVKAKKPSLVSSQDIASDVKSDQPPLIPPPTKYLFPKDLVYNKWLGLDVAPIGSGLTNFGNTCFMNSVLQCLTYTPPLKNFLTESTHQETCRAIGFCTMCEFQKLNRDVSAKSKGVVDPIGFVRNLRAIAKHFRPMRQEDAHEFARYVIDGLQKACLQGMGDNVHPTIANTTIIGQTFGGSFQSQIKCTQCGYESNTYDPFMDISLEISIPSCHSLARVFNHFTKPELLQGDNAYKCSGCSDLVKATKTLTVAELPNILTVHLKRFDFTGHGNKISKAIEYPVVLDARPYCAKDSDIQKGVIYDLYGVLVHHGHSVHSGHYYCFIKAGNGAWYCMNDESVKQVSVGTVMVQQAYVLWYVRRNEKKEVVVENEKGTEKKKRKKKRKREETDELPVKKSKRRKEEKKNRKEEKRKKKIQEKEEEKRKKRILEKEKEEKEEIPKKTTKDLLKEIAQSDHHHMTENLKEHPLFEFDIPAWDHDKETLNPKRTYMSKEYAKKRIIAGIESKKGRRRSAYDDWYDAGKTKKIKKGLGRTQSNDLKDSFQREFDIRKRGMRMKRR